FKAHSDRPQCAGCHAQLDPYGFALENYDPIGQWRDNEKGTPIDAVVTLPGRTTPTNGPIDLVKTIAHLDEAQTCFATHWLEFAYGKTVDAGDACTQDALGKAFLKSGGNVKQLLLDLTQTDAFLYLPAKD